MTASQASAVPSAIGGPQIPSFSDISPAATASKSSTSASSAHDLRAKSIHLISIFSSARGRAVPNRGCTTSTAHFLQHHDPHSLKSYILINISTHNIISAHHRSSLSPSFIPQILIKFIL